MRCTDCSRLFLLVTLPSGTLRHFCVFAVRLLFFRRPLTICNAEDGAVYTWGRGDDGRLGHGDNGWKYVPRVVEALEGQRIVQVGYFLKASEETLAASSLKSVGYTRHDAVLIYASLSLSFPPPRSLSLFWPCSNVIHHTPVFRLIGRLFGWFTRQGPARQGFTVRNVTGNITMSFVGEFQHGGVRICSNAHLLFQATSLLVRVRPCILSHGAGIIFYRMLCTSCGSVESAVLRLKQFGWASDGTILKVACRHGHRSPLKYVCV